MNPPETLDGLEVFVQLRADLGPAPAGVCSRMYVGGTPCGAVAIWHVIWDHDLHNGALCARHGRLTRRKHVYAGMHPYAPACANHGLWQPEQDHCTPQPEGEHP